MTRRLTVSLVVPAYDEESTIRRCLDAALAQTDPLDEILVVDNRSTDRTREIVEDVARRAPTVRIISQNAAQGIVPTRNAGFDAATGDILGRVDSDSVIAADWASHVRRAFSDTDVAAISGPVAYYDMPMRSFFLKADNRVRELMVKLSGKYVFLFGSNMAVRASAWRAVRDDTCPDRDDQMHEDIDLAVHLALHGLRVGYEPTLVAGISARRMDSSRREYSEYVGRFERTYAAHGITERRVLAPTVVLRGLYPAVHLDRKIRAELGALDIAGAPKLGMDEPAHA